MPGAKCFTYNFQINPNNHPMLCNSNNNSIISPLFLIKNIAVYRD